MSFVVAMAIVLLMGVMTLSSYVARLYSERGKFLSRESEENIDIWETAVEPRLGFTRERAELSARLLRQLALGFVALLFGAILFARTPAGRFPSLPEICQALLGLFLAIVVFNEALPFVFFTRTRGHWIARLVGVLRLLFYLVLPGTLFLSFLNSITALAEPPPGKVEENSNGMAVEALIEAGEEEGIIEESARDLVRSAVEFGDKVVREVMTPRPNIFAVPASMTIENLILELRQEPYSRIPVYIDSIDQISGVTFAHDLLQITDEAARIRTVASVERDVAFVPENKPVNELLREMQRQKQHMRIVIDEYGGVAGLVTIEDLLEEIVGNIADEHEEGDEKDVPVPEAGGTWLVPGSLELDRLEELIGEGARIEQRYHSATAAGLVSEIAGRVPQPGEVFVAGPLRFEVVDATGFRIERLRVSPIDSAPHAISF